MPLTALILDTLLLASFPLSGAPVVEHAAQPDTPISRYSAPALTQRGYEAVRLASNALQAASVRQFADNWAFYLEGDDYGSAASAGTLLLSGEGVSYSALAADESRVAGAVGVRARWFGREGHHLVALLGRDEQAIDLTRLEGMPSAPGDYDYIAPVLPGSQMPELETWKLGFATEHSFRWGTIGLRIEMQEVDLASTADWQARAGRALPATFAQRGSGEASVVTLGYTHEFVRDWRLHATYTYRDYRFDDERVNGAGFAAGGNLLAGGDLDYADDSLMLGLSYSF